MSQKLFNRDFTLVAIGQLISLFGNAILRFALALYVLDATGSAAVFGTVTAIAVIPTILLSPFGGILSDRVNRRNIMAALTSPRPPWRWASACCSRRRTP